MPGNICPSSWSNKTPSYGRRSRWPLQWRGGACGESRQSDYSCGYEKAFQEYANIIQQKYPHIRVEGENYQPPRLSLVISRILSVSRLSLIFLIITGFNIFEIFQIAQPVWWSWCIDNKIYSSMMVYFMCNSFESMLMSTGAFEITFNDVPVWSKLETGRIPQPPELFQIIDNTLQFQNKADLKPNFPK
ncbi:thioredoxin reductase-like selenoprotein T homolog CG3887 isoform X2 [Schistocerca cancellata]|uniref:thioredoxin reductase-like selenoprotein T homolog CG3887 isoform X2 n=1 Tax=Schistocerca cancellata TaxID=274614 RepID=UPI0021191143|nr:thioredoxin reductase-like selenoprotein T homolog CG3887 isoform X2 [Schistocerca cancellata]